MQDVQRYQSVQLNDLEEEERRKNEELRQRAFAQVQEQEDEIKQLNEVSCMPLLSTSVEFSSRRRSFYTPNIQRRTVFRM